jgi:hypothetical protein
MHPLVQLAVLFSEEVDAFQNMLLKWGYMLHVRQRFIWKFDQAWIIL